MNREELEIQFLKLLHNFIEIKMERRQNEAPFLPVPIDELPAEQDPISPYAPMLRLLNGEDERFLWQCGLRRAASEIRRCHRRCFVGYVTLLGHAARTVRRERVESMQSSGVRNFDEILARAIRIEIALFSLRWLAWKHRARLHVAPAEVAAQLDVILGAWRSAEVTAL